MERSEARRLLPLQRRDRQGDDDGEHSVRVSSPPIRFGVVSPCHSSSHAGGHEVEEVQGRDRDAGERLIKAGDRSVRSCEEFQGVHERYRAGGMVVRIDRTIRQRRLTQAAAAERMGIDQPKISAMLFRPVPGLFGRAPHQRCRQDGFDRRPQIIFPPLNICMGTGSRWWCNYQRDNRPERTHVKGY
jgi:hypothetical protein